MKQLPHKHISGFTLIEVMIGLVLLGMTMTMLFSGLYTASHSWSAGDQQTQLNDDSRIALFFIRRLIRQTVPLLYLGNTNSALYRGRDDSLQFVTRLPAHRGGTDLYVVFLEVTTQENGEQVLLLKYKPLLTNGNPYEYDSNSEVHELIHNINAVLFSYYGSPTPDVTPGWYTSWETHSRLPELVSIKFESSKQEITWPELQISIPAQVEQNLPQLVVIGK